MADLSSSIVLSRDAVTLVEAGVLSLPPSLLHLPPKAQQPAWRRGAIARGRTQGSFTRLL